MSPNNTESNRRSVLKKIGAGAAVGVTGVVSSTGTATAGWDTPGDCYTAKLECNDLYLYDGSQDCPELYESCSYRKGTLKECQDYCGTHYLGLSMCDSSEFLWVVADNIDDCQWTNDCDSYGCDHSDC